MPLGDIVRFSGYCDPIGALCGIFESGKLGLVVGFDEDGVICQLIDEVTGSVTAQSDILFPEEFVTWHVLPLDKGRTKRFWLQALPSSGNAPLQ